MRALAFQRSLCSIYILFQFPQPSQHRCRVPSISFLPARSNQIQACHYTVSHIHQLLQHKFLGTVYRCLLRSGKTEFVTGSAVGYPVELEVYVTPGDLGAGAMDDAFESFRA